MSEHWRQQLNDTLQRTSYGIVQWEDKAQGPQHCPTWVAYAKIRGELYGCGDGPSMGHARERAAKQACEVLKKRFGV